MSEPELIQAARAGDVDRLKYLLTSGSNVEERDEHGMSALHVAAEKGHLEVIKELIEHGAQINAVQFVHGEEIPYTPVEAATSRGHLDVVKYLSEKGATLYESDGPWGYICTMLSAAASGSVAMARYLHEEKRLPIDEGDPRGMTPLLLAVEKGNEDIFRYLVQHGADPNKKGKVYPSPAEFAQEMLHSSRADDSLKQRCARILECIEHSNLNLVGAEEKAIDKITIDTVEEQKRDQSRFEGEPDCVHLPVEPSTQRALPRWAVYLVCFVVALVIFAALVLLCYVVDTSYARQVKLRA